MINQDQDDSIFREMMRRLEKHSNDGFGMHSKTHAPPRNLAARIQQQIHEEVKKSQTRLLREEGIEPETPLPVAGVRLKDTSPFARRNPDAKRIIVERREVGSRHWDIFASMPNERIALKTVEKGNKNKLHEYRIKP